MRELRAVSAQLPVCKREIWDSVIQSDKCFELPKSDGVISGRTWSWLVKPRVVHSRAPGLGIRSRMASFAFRHLEPLVFPVDIFQSEFGNLVGSQSIGHKKEQDGLISPTSDRYSVHRF